MTARDFGDFIKGLLFEVENAFPFGSDGFFDKRIPASSPPMNVSRAKPRINPEASKLFEDERPRQMLPSNAASSGDSDLSSVVRNALSSDGVITVRGDRASVGKKPTSRGGFSKMPKKQYATSGANIFNFSAKLTADPENASGEEAEQIVNALTSHLRDPEERRKQAETLMMSLGQQKGESINKKQEKQLENLQAESIRKNLAQADFQEAQLTGDPRERLFALAKMRKGKPPLADDLEGLFELTLASKLPEGLPLKTALNLLTGPTKLTTKGRNKANIMEKASGATINSPEDLLELLSIMREFERE